MNAETQHQEKESGLKYILNIEGTEYSWEQDTITTEQIAVLGKWDVSQGVIEVDKDNNERNLQPGEIVHIKPGHGFGKKHKWKRGLLRSRIEQELALLRQFYPDLAHMEQGNVDWFLLPRYPVPQGWRIHSEEITQVRVCFPIEMGYPTAQPYGFLMPAGINFRNTPPGNSGSATSPFGGQWHQFSWSPETWFPNADHRKGSNLPAWVRSFTERLREGA